MNLTVIKVFWKDHSLFSRPPDTNNPGKFKLNGGGILIPLPQS